MGSTNTGVRFDVLGSLPSDVSELRQFVLVSTTIFTILSTLTLVLRFLARWRSQQPLCADDWLIVAGYLIALMPIVCIYIQLEYGLAYHIYNLDAATKSVFFKANFALQRANQPALACIKISILLFYIRIFTTNKFKYLAWANIGYTLIWAIAGWTVNILVCRPIQFFWDKSIQGGYCTSQQISGSLNGAFGALGDILILCLPIYMTWQLHLNQRKKLAVSMIFLLGAFVCFASVYRIIVITRSPPEDFTYAQAQPGVWTVIEMQAAIISANLPCLAPLFKKIFRSREADITRPSILVSSIASRKAVQSSPSHTNRWNNYNDQTTLNEDGLEGLNDSDAGSNANSTTNIELHNVAQILVRTEIRTDDQQSLSNSEVDEMHKRTISGWLQ